MLEILEGTKSEFFHLFTQLAIKGFLASRQIMEQLLTLVSAMADSGLPCFMHKANNLMRMRQRFCPQKNDIEAAEYMKRLINDAANKWTTTVYDGIQKLQNNIYSEVWK